MNIIPASKQESFGHYYDQYGMAVQGGLRMARPCRAFPSVTTIQSIAKNYGLERYKREQFGLSLLTTPRNRGETDEQFIDRADEGAHEHSARAMEKGTHIHQLFENLDEIKLKIKEENELDQKRCKMLLDWKEENILSVEKKESVVISKEYGFAGRFDTLARMKDGTKTGERVLLDLKTCVPKDGKMTPWPSYCVQLSAYLIALGEDIPTANIMFSSTEDLAIELHRWSDKETKRAKQAFLGLVAYWQWSNKYWPHTEGNTNVP